MPTPEIVDCHTHSSFSDGKNSLAENMRAARAQGLSTIACTDHWGPATFIDCSMDTDRLCAYIQEIDSLRRDFPELDIICGLEVDWYEGCETQIGDVRKHASFLLGAVHYLLKKPIDWEEDLRIWKELGTDEVWRLYAQTWCKATTSKLFDSMAHPDLPRLFSDSKRLAAINKKPLWDAMAEAAWASSVHVEINTAGLCKTFRDFYPEQGLLERFCKAGIPLTVGSDAHNARRIGADIHAAYHHAQAAGYRSIDVPTPDGAWRCISLDDF